MEQNLIIPGKEISGYQLNWTVDDLRDKLTDYKVDKHKYCQIIHSGNFSFWINNDNGKITQIGVTGNYNGKIANKIGIGSTLEDVKKYFGGWDEDLDVYIIPHYEGVSFELADNGIDEEWIEEKMPINAIYVYNPKGSSLDNK